MLLYNGQLSTASDFALPLPNRGLFFNDGFFETLIWDEGGIRYLPHHLQRMQRAAQVLALTLPPALASENALTTTLGRLATHAQMPEGALRLRLQLWRSGGGVYAPSTTSVEWLATVQPFVPHDAPILAADFASTVHTHASAVSFCKGPNALTYVLAARERALRGLDEIILLSGAGYVAETVSAALIWIRKETVYSPTEATGAVAGTRLAHLQTIAQQLGLNWETGLYKPEHLVSAEAIFTANVAGLRSIQRIGNIAVQTENHPIFAQFLASK